MRKLLLAFLFLASPAHGRGIVITASSVEAVEEKLQSVRPPITTPGFDGYFLSLGDFGPLASYGPLGMLGPIGDASYNASTVFKMFGDWSRLARFYSMNGGPLSAEGPLGPNGPLSDAAYRSDLLAFGDLGKQLQLGGVLGVMGPLGPLGALGPLGPLGPNGGHGYYRDDDGNYRAGGKRGQIVRSADAAGATYGLVEVYTAEAARKLGDNDTSFVVADSFTAAGDKARFTFHSAERQWVTVVALGEYQLDTYELTVSDAAGVVGKSSSTSLTNFVQAQVDAGATLTATIELKGSGHFLPKKYRLIVTGSGERFYDTDISGKHQK